MEFGGGQDTRQGTGLLFGEDMMEGNEEQLEVKSEGMARAGRGQNR